MADDLRGTAAQSATAASALHVPMAAAAAADSQACGSFTVRHRRDSSSESVGSNAESSGMEVRRTGSFHLVESHAAKPSPMAVAGNCPSPQRLRESTLKVSSSFSGSQRSGQSVTTVKSLDSTLADGHTHVHPSSVGRYVRFNVGGSLFSTTIATVCKRDTMLRAMFTGELAVQVDSDGKQQCV